MEHGLSLCPACTRGCSPLVSLLPGSSALSTPSRATLSKLLPPCLWRHLGWQDLG